MGQFDDLFDKFFNRNNKDKNDNEKNDLNDAKSRIMDLLKSMSNFNINDDDEKEIDNSLGEPDLIEFYTENGLYYEKRIWKTENGHLVKLLVSETPFNNTQNKIEPKNLQEQLEIAVKNEDYLKAATLRDLINPKKKRIRKTK